VLGGSPNPDLQRLTVHMLDLQIEHKFSHMFVWVPWDLNVSADFLSHVSEMLHHHHRLLEEWFAYLDRLCGQRTIDWSAAAAVLPARGALLLEVLPPERVDAVSLSWEGENNRVFPPTHLVGSAVAQAHL
jgi:hypothetical protein